MHEGSHYFMKTRRTEKKEYENIIESVCQEGAYIYGLDEDAELSVVLL